MAIGLPVIWEYMLHHPEKCIDHRGQEYLEGIFKDIAHAMKAYSVENAISEFRLMLDMMEIGKPKSENREADLEVLSTSVNPIRLKNNPVGLNVETIKSIYEKMVI